MQPRHAAGPGQESVWDYPRPPRVETSTDLVEVELGGVVVASTTGSWRVLETSHPPTYYLPRAAFGAGVLREVGGSTWCEWKGQATYFDLASGDHVAIRQRAGVVAADPSADPELLHDLGERLSAHVRLEERELFPLIERDMPADELVALALALDDPA